MISKSWCKIKTVITIIDPMSQLDDDIWDTNEFTRLLINLMVQNWWCLNFKSWCKTAVYIEENLFAITKKKLDNIFPNKSFFRYDFISSFGIILSSKTINRFQLKNCAHVDCIVLSFFLNRIWLFIGYQETLVLTEKQLKNYASQ